MEIQTVFNFFNLLKDDSLSFLYHGFMSDEFTEKIITLSEKNLEKINDSKGIKNKVSFLIAESFQNIIRHGDSFEEEKNRFNKPGIFIFRIIGETYVISSANLINDKNIENVAQKLSQINNLNKDELKTLFQDIIQNTEISDKGGAGLGLIEMARKTGNKLEYEFEKIDENFSLFYLQLKFNTKQATDEMIQELPIALTKDFYDVMNLNNTYLTYKGDFSQENVLILLKIIERNLKINTFEHESVKSLIYIILTELLQNISKHGYSFDNKKEGIFMIGKYFNKYVLSSGNLIENNKIQQFKAKIDFLNKMNKTELHKLYVEKIKLGNTDDYGNAGLGFIEIAKECDEIKYNVFAINEEYSFLTISLKI
jgi:hypothetical protein